MLDLCRRISTEMDPLKMSGLVDELIQLLNEEQDVIKSKIRANLGSRLASED